MPAQHTPSQSDLFAASGYSPRAAQRPKKSPSHDRLPCAMRKGDAPEPVVLTEADMPEYDAAVVAFVDVALAALPIHQLWFTYRDIAASFGISRATVVRRVRDRLVPGIRMAGDRLVADGAVRRFDRRQVRWLLLAARTTPRGRDTKSNESASGRSK